MFSSNPWSPSRKMLYLGNEFTDDEELAETLRKTFYYGKPPTTDRPSLPLTEIAVEFFQEAAPRELGKLDTYFAASSSRHACMSPCSVMMGMLYAKRLRQKNPEYLQQVSSSDLFLISMMLASKFMYDEGVDDEVFNDEWAAASDMDLEDINQLERQFLSAIDWQLFVKPKEFQDLMNLVQKQIALSQGVNRGWFSYTDLWLLSQDSVWLDIGRDITQVLWVSSLAYIAGILTMIGSTLLVTAASTALASLGPLVLPSGVQIQSPVHDASIAMSGLKLPSPAPVICHSCNSVNESEVMHITDFEGTVTPSLHEQIDRTAEDKKDNFDQTQTVDTTSVNSYLPSLLVLVTLKDTMLNFVLAVKDKYGNSQQTATDFKHTSETFCSNGPCLPEAWSTCWNVTDNELRDFKEAFEETRCYGHCGNFRKLNSDLKHCSNGYEYQSIVKCCCAKELSGNLIHDNDYGPIQSTFPDLFVGISTTLSPPILVNT